MKPLIKPTLLYFIVFSVMLISCEKSKPSPPQQNNPPNYNYYVGPDNPVFESTVYNGNLVIGGNFITVDNKPISGLAQWDGTGWSGFPPGGGGAGDWWSALAVYNGKLVSMLSSPAEWDGTKWTAMGTGIQDTKSNGEINAMTIYNNKLVVAGRFNYAGGKKVDNIALWNDTAWSAIDSADGSCTIYSSTVYNGNLIVGGVFDSIGGIAAHNIAMWNGTSWSALGNGTGPYVEALTVYNGNLIAGGDFDSAGGAPARKIAVWNGSSWSPLDTGLNKEVYALIVYNGNLIIGDGGYSNNTRDCLLQWDGTRISNPFGEFEFYSPTIIKSPPPLYVKTLCIYNGNLIAGGFFTVVNGIYTGFAAEWNGSSWVIM